ncbi:ATP-grasp domain-containing protein [Kitasatospora mediocidica]|uniref:ATP-grasp domain-containing protein n=1 Tax=Kitasatospora mediocidica TaxID=58352 RepID=UPI0007C6BEA0|nr:ATP-grasp domain-containing protein [Kitasatospora mediocidica]
MAVPDPHRPAVIVDPFSSGGMYAPAFTAAGVPVIAVTSYPEVPAAYADSFHPGDFTRVLAFDGDVERLVAELRPYAPRCVLPGAESGVELADRLTERLNPRTVNTPALATARRDKGAMALAVRAAGLPGIRQICTDDPDEVERWLADARLGGRDLVVKPPRSGSTDGVTRVPAGQDWRVPFNAQLGRTNQWRNLNDRMVVQEYAVGTEYVVDTFSHGGRHTVADVCRYGKIDNGEQMAVYESLNWVSPEDPAVPVLTAYAEAVLDAVGFRYGAAHIEVMLTAEGPRLVEVNSRPHGGGHPDFCRTATGDSQLHRAVRWFTEGSSIPKSYQLLRQMTVLFLIARSSGTVRNVGALAGVEKLASHHRSAVRLKDGDRVHATRDLLDTLQLGFVVLSHRDERQLNEDIAAVRRLEGEVVIEEETSEKRGEGFVEEPAVTETAEAVASERG